MIEMYKNGYSTTEIGDLANVSSRYVSSVLTKNDVQKRPHGSWKRKYQLNEDYFKTWSNNMVYILGFFVADGNIPRDAQTVSISQKEKYILEDIKKEMGSDHPLYKNKNTGVYILNFNSKVMKQDLMQLHGITPNKSTSIEFPFVPEEYMSHFIRGYFDGDGFINYPKYFISFVDGSYSFMISLREELERNGFETNFTNHTTFYRVYVSGRKSIKLFSNWIYKDKELFLHRKYDAFQQESLDISLLKDGIKMHKNAIAKRKQREE
ncbi:endonuclease [Aquibacillus halophilus]|uniref:Endonuclease n=2 Tax=Aquibacillus halophilus TaxID=930132 RepID=A0A6A8DF58_9BACI|nr:endonuclease [Aquibacillus halophilus]